MPASAYWSKEEGNIGSSHVYETLANLRLLPKIVFGYYSDISDVINGPLEPFKLHCLKSQQQMDGITPRDFAEFLTSARLSLPVGVMTKVKRTSRFAAGKNRKGFFLRDFLSESEKLCIKTSKTISTRLFLQKIFLRVFFS